MRITFVPVKSVMTIPARAAGPMSSRQASSGMMNSAIQLVRVAREFIASWFARLLTENRRLRQRKTGDLPATHPA